MTGPGDRRSDAELLLASAKDPEAPESLRRWVLQSEVDEGTGARASREVFFCDPRSPWQRGTSENTNGLLRQYLPRRANLSFVTQARLDEIAAKLSSRPRKTLGFKTPADILEAALR